MLAAVGHSYDLDSSDAVREAIDACLETLDGKTPQAGLLFAGIDHDHQALLDGIGARFPGLQLIGCTTHGELSSGGRLLYDGRNLLAGRVGDARPPRQYVLSPS